MCKFPRQCITGKIVSSFIQRLLFNTVREASLPKPFFKLPNTVSAKQNCCCQYLVIRKFLFGFLLCLFGLVLFCLFSEWEWPYFPLFISCHPLFYFINCLLLFGHFSSNMIYKNYFYNEKEQRTSLFVSNVSHTLLLFFFFFCLLTLVIVFGSYRNFYAEKFKILFPRASGFCLENTPPF